MAIVIPIVAKFVDEGLDKAKQGIQEAESGWQKSAKAMEALAAPAAAIVASMGVLGVKLAKAAGGNAKANKKLEASFKAVGWEENSAAAIKYAESLQHVIGVSDDEIKATMQKLAAFEDVAASQDLMARATQSAADMSAAGFGTMESAATALGKALQDPEKNLGALTRMGVTFTKGQKDQIKAMVEAGDAAGAQAAIMKEVEGTFAGVAEASASGTEKMKLAWNETAEVLGESLAPVLGIVMELLKRVAVFVGENANAFLILAGVITGLSLAILAANAAFKVYAAITKIVTAVQWAFGLAMGTSTAGIKLYAIASKIGAAAQRVFNKAIWGALGPISLVIGIVIALAIVIIKNWDQIKEVTLRVWGWLEKFVVDTWNTLKDSAIRVFNAIREKVDEVWQKIKAIFTTNPFTKPAEHIATLLTEVTTGFQSIKAKIEEIWGKVKDVFTTNPFTSIQGFLSTMEGWFASSIGRIVSKMEELVRRVRGAAESVKGAFNKAKELADNMPKPGKDKSATGSAALSRAIAMPVSASLAGGVPVPSATAVPMQRGGSGGLTINVNGALDPERVARQIRDLLDSHDRRQGRTPARAVAF